MSAPFILVAAACFMPSAYNPTPLSHVSSTPAVQMGWKFWKRSNEADAESETIAELRASLATLQEQQKAMEDQLEMHDELIATLMNNQATQEAAAAAAAEEAAAITAAAQEAAEEPAEEDLITRADALHASNSVDELFDLLKDADTKDDEIAWRLARAYHDKAEDSEEAAKDRALKEKLLRDGLAVAEGLKDGRRGGGYALKWYAILLGRLGDFLPTKEKVGNSYKIKESLEGAAELLPEDASVQTALGQWCYKVASISWIERGVASALFGSPPESSYEEALGFVKASYAIRPSKKASLYAGLCCMELKEKEEAAEWLDKCLGLETAGEGDKEIDRQAEAAMAKVR